MMPFNIFKDVGVICQTCKLQEDSFSFLVIFKYSKNF